MDCHLGCQFAEGGGLGMGRGEARALEGSSGSGHSSGPSKTSCCVSDTPISLLFP